MRHPSVRGGTLRLPLEAACATTGLSFLAPTLRAAPRPRFKIAGVETRVLNCDPLFVMLRTEAGIMG